MENHIIYSWLLTDVLRAMIYWVYENKTAKNTIDFMDKCLDFFPFIITHILTDNGLEFTNRFWFPKKEILVRNYLKWIKNV
jgi:hypothetical protein